MTERMNMPLSMFSLFILRILPCNRILTVKNQSIRSNILRSHPRHLLCRPHYKILWARYNQPRIGLLKDLTSTIKKRKICMVLPHHKSQQSFHCRLTRYNLKQKNKNQMVLKRTDNFPKCTSRVFREAMRLSRNRYL